jgi:hypothetical protein
VFFAFVTTSLATPDPSLRIVPQPGKGSADFYVRSIGVIPASLPQGSLASLDHYLYFKERFWDFSVSNGSAFLVGEGGAPIPDGPLF